jgi:hypothetical protein
LLTDDQISFPGDHNGSADVDQRRGTWYDDEEPVLDEEEVDPDDIPETHTPRRDPPSSGGGRMERAGEERNYDSVVKTEQQERRISDWADEVIEI